MLAEAKSGFTVRSEVQFGGRAQGCTVAPTRDEGPRAMFPENF